MVATSSRQHGLAVLCWLLCLVVGVNGSASRFQYKPGLFVQGDPNLPLPAANAPRMGLEDGKTWQDVRTTLDAKRPSGVLTKFILFVRHGQGTHNVAIDKYGSEMWNAYYCKLPEYLDAPLTSMGLEQARNASAKLDAEIDNGLQIDHVLISPLERALRTYTTVYQSHQSIPNTPLELPREMLGVDTCDERRNISVKSELYPQLDFSGFESDADPWWKPDHREIDTEIDARAIEFLELLFYNVSARRVGVVSHSLFGAALLRVIGHRLYNLTTAEFLPLIVEATGTPLTRALSRDLTKTTDTGILFCVVPLIVFPHRGPYKCSPLSRGPSCL